MRPGAEKYQARERHLYALRFPGRRVYIGQTVNLHRRAYQHHRAWPEDFEMLPLSTMHGTEAEAEDWEYAWRHVARRAGMTVLARSRDGEPFIVRDTGARMTLERYRIAKRLRWPVTATSTARRIRIAVGWLLAAAALLWALARVLPFAHRLPGV